jgi:homoserine kinase
VKARCKSVGALGGGISGSGPSIFMLSAEKAIAQAVEKEMKETFQRIGIENHTYVTTLNKEGVKIQPARVSVEN